MENGNTVHNDGDGQLSARVLELIEIMKDLVARGKRASDVTSGDWAPLAELVDPGDFERVGPFHDALDWAGYVEMLTQWVNQTDGWDPVIKRISEAPGVVYMQCEEMITMGESVNPFYSLSMYEFNGAMKIRRINVYMQQSTPTSG